MSDTTLTLTWDEGCKPWLAASDDETRPILMSVCLDGAGYMVATDTHILAIVKADVPAAYSGRMISAAFLKEAARHKNKSLEFEGDYLVGRAPFGEIRCKLDAEGTFPRWGKVIESLKEREAMDALAINPRLLIRAADILGVSKDKGVTLCFAKGRTPEGDRPYLGGPILVGHREQFRGEERGSFCVVMPMECGPDYLWDLAQASAAAALRGPAQATLPTTEAEAPQ